MKRTSRPIIICIAGIVLLSIAAISYWHVRPTNDGSRPVGQANTSKQGRITLKEPGGTSLDEASQIAGTYRQHADDILLYSIANKNRTPLASGIIVSESSSFSRNISFDTKPQPGQELVVTVFTQNKKGVVTDTVSKTVTYRE